MILCPLLKQCQWQNILLQKFYKNYVSIGIWIKIPERTGLYLYLSGWMLFCIVISTAYAALLSSMMTIPVFNPTIKTIYELAKAQNEGRIQIMTHMGSNYYKMIRVESISIIFDILIFVPIIQDNDEYAFFNYFCFARIQNLSLKNCGKQTTPRYSI